MEEAACRRAWGEVRDDEIPGIRQTGMYHCAEDLGDNRGESRREHRHTWLVYSPPLLPLREGSTSKRQQRKLTSRQSSRTFSSRRGASPSKQVDEVTLRTHLNDLAKGLSEGRVEHARFYLAIFEEAIGQDFVTKNPARKPALPKQLRPVDRTTLSWDQLAIHAGIGFAPGSRPAKARYDRNLSPQRVICAAVRWF